MKRLPVAPNRDLGQHFLVDENILGVIGRLAELAPVDVVLEIGPGLGVLTRYLADRVAHVHAVELDTALEPHLRERLEGRTNVDVVLGDALRLDLAGLSPVPQKLVANLPYNVATPLVVESLAGLPRVELWCVMVQREVAERFFAEPRTKAYGAVSVLVQLAARRIGFHAVSRTAFKPPPNVDSALVAFRRVPLPGDFTSVKRVVEAAFAHRRKTLPNSLALARLANRERAAAALEAIGRRASSRAEELAPPEFVALADEAGVSPRWEARLTKRIPVASGLGGGSSDAATALRLANETLDTPLEPERLAAIARRLGADVPFFLAPGPQLGTGDGSELAPVDLPQDYWVVLVVPAGEQKSSTADVYAGFDARRGVDGFDERRERLLAVLPTLRRPRDLARLPPNDLASSPVAAELLELGAFRADVTGAGPAVYGLFDRRDAAEAARSRIGSRGRAWLTVPAWYF